MNNHWLDSKKNRTKNEATLESLQAENALLREKVETLEAEYNAKLEEAYEQFHNELMEAEKTAEQGYQEAYDIICDLRNQLDEARKPSSISPDVFKAMGFTPISPSVNDDLEVRLHNEYEQKLKDMKKHIVDKVDAFLKMEAEERDNILAARLRKNYTPQQIVDAALES